MDFYKILEDIMKKKSMSIAELARACELSDSTIRSIISRKSKSVALEVAFKISYGLDIPLEQLNGEPLNNKPVHEEACLTSLEKHHIKKYRNLDDYGKKAVDSILDIEYKRIESLQEHLETKHNVITLPEFEQPVSAGTGVYLGDGSQSVIREVPNTEVTRKANCILRVSGNSMEPAFFDGDKLLVKYQPTVEIGEKGIFIINNEGFVKVYQGDRLVSLHPDYEDIYFTEYDSIECKGKVIGKL